MFELVLKFENAQAREAVAKDVLNIEVGEYVENTAPNHAERIGDTIFFTRQPEVELTTTQYAVVEPNGSQVVSEVSKEEVFTELSGSSGEGQEMDETEFLDTVGVQTNSLENTETGQSYTYPLAEVSEENTTQKEEPEEVL